MSSYQSKKKKPFIIDVPFEFTGGEEIFYEDDDIEEEDDKKKVKKEETDDDADVLKRGPQEWREELYRRGPDGRFLPKSGLASSAAAILPKTKNERKKENVERGFRRGYAAHSPYDAKIRYDLDLARALEGVDSRAFPPAELDELRAEAEAAGGVWRLDWKKRHKIRDLEVDYPISKQPGYAEGLAAGAAQRVAELNARDPDEGRVTRKLPKLKGKGDRDAGFAAAAGVAKKRRAWMRNRAESMILTMAPDHPQREYWEGVIAGANNQDLLERSIYGFKGDEAQGREEGFDVARDRREEAIRRADLMLVQIPEGHAERPYWVGRKAGLEEAMKLPDNRPTFKVGEDVARGAGDLGALAQQAEIERDEIANRARQEGPLPNDERMDIYWQGVQHGLQREQDVRKRGDDAFAAGVAAGKEDLAIAGPARRENVIQRNYQNLRRAREEDRRYFEGALVALGAPIEPVDKQDYNYKLGKQLAQNDLSFFKEDAARAALAAAENDKNEAGTAYWTGVLDALLGPKPPPPLTGVPNASDLPARGGTRDVDKAAWNVMAAAHRQPGDAHLLGPFKPRSARGHGEGGINGSIRATLANGEEVLVKPVSSQYHRKIYNAIPQGGDLPRERAAFLVIQKLGIEPNVRPVAREIDMSDQPGFEDRSGLAIVQEWTDPAEPVIFSANGWQTNKEDLRKLGILDAVIGNMDRHARNALVAPGPPQRLVPIDHGLSFPEGRDHSDKREVIHYTEGSELTSEEREQLKVIASNEFAQELLDLGLSEAAVIQMRKRVRVILEKNAIPSMKDLGMRAI